MVKELLRTIPHALSGRSKFGRTLKYMSPVTTKLLAKQEDVVLKTRLFSLL